MANPKDESAKGSARPGESSAGKRPYATLDLQATEVGGVARAGSGTDDTKAGEQLRSGFADGMRATGARIAALKGYLPSGSFLSHMGAGVLGALIVALAGYVLLPAPNVDPRQAIALRQLATRLADAEAVLGAQPGDSSGLVARTEELARTVRSLGDAQAQLTVETKSLATKSGTGERLPADIAARLAKLEQALTAAQPVEPGEGSKAVLATLDRELASVRTEAARLAQRIDTMKSDTEERMRSIVRSADIAPLQAKLAWLEKEMQAFLKSEGERSANSARVLLSLELANLKRVMDRGEPFTAELASVKRAAGDRLDLKLLERYMREGVPTTTDIAKSFRKVSNAMLDAETEPPDASIVDRLLSGAKSIVRVRKAGHNPDDTSLEAIAARMETALKEGRLAEVLAQGKKLPPKATLAAEEWLQQVEARHTVDQAMADIEGTLKSSLTGTPPSAKEQRR